MWDTGQAAYEWYQTGEIPDWYIVSLVAPEIVSAGMKKLKKGKKVSVRSVKKLDEFKLPDEDFVKKKIDDVFEGTGELVQVTAGKNFKDHFIRHKKLLEGLLGTKYPKYKADGARFIDDIGKAINEGYVEFVGDATLRGGDEVYKIYK